MNMEKGQEPKKEAKSRRPDWRVLRLVGSRIFAASLVTAAILTIEGDVQETQQVVDDLTEVVCASPTPDQQEACDQLDDLDADGTDNLRLSLALLAANGLIVSDTVARYRRLKSVSEKVASKVGEIEERLDHLDRPDPEPLA